MRLATLKQAFRRASKDIFPGQLADYTNKRCLDERSRFTSTELNCLLTRCEEEDSFGDFAVTCLCFPVRAVADLAMNYLGIEQLSVGNAIDYTSVLDYIVGEILESAVKEREDDTLHPRHIMLGVRNDGELDKTFPGVFSFCGVVPTVEKPFVDALLNHDEDDDEDDDDDDKILTICQAKKLFREVPDKLDNEDDTANLWRAMILRLCAKASIVKARTSALGALQKASEKFVGDAMWSYEDGLCECVNKYAHRVADVFPSKIVSPRSNLYGMMYLTFTICFIFRCRPPFS